MVMMHTESVHGTESEHFIQVFTGRVVFCPISTEYHCVSRYTAKLWDTKELGTDPDLENSIFQE